MGGLPDQEWRFKYFFVVLALLLSVAIITVSCQPAAPSVVDNKSKETEQEFTNSIGQKFIKISAGTIMYDGEPVIRGRSCY